MQDDRRISVRTLAIASLASAAAAVITSQFWIRGTPIAAALTPVIVALVSELLHRPTEKIAQRLTTETDALPEAAGAGPPPRSEEVAPRPALDPQVRVYRPRRRRIAWAVVLATGLLGFAIAAVTLTVPELIAGGSLGKGERNTTVFGGGRQGGEDRRDATVTEQETVTETETAPPAETAPEPTTTTPTTPRTPRSPAPQEPPPTTTTPPPTTQTAPPAN